MRGLVVFLSQVGASNTALRAVKFSPVFEPLKINCTALKNAIDFENGAA